MTRRLTSIASVVLGSVAVATLVACSAAPHAGSQTPTSNQAPSSTSPAGTTDSPGGQLRELTITVTGRKVTPAPARISIERGETLRLTVTSDHDDELHAHGFDVEVELTAGRPSVVELTGAAPGLYDIETHHPELRLLQVLVK